MSNLSGQTNRRVIAVNVKPPRPVAAASTIGIKRLLVQLSAGSIPARDIRPGVRISERLARRP